MPVTRCSVVCFSPTGSTRRIAETVAKGAGLPTVLHDLTLPAARKNAALTFSAADLVILAVPVYFGRVPRLAALALTRAKGEKTPTILAVNYGNRHYDDALLELGETARAAGFVPLAAGAFVSRHSYHTDAFPMAPGRPDAADLEKASRLGREAAALAAGTVPEPLALPGNTPYRPYPDICRAPVMTDDALADCTSCGACAAVCPSGAVSVDAAGPVTDEKLCIICQACVAACPLHLRRDTAPGAIQTRERLTPLVKDRKEAELFFPAR